MSRWLARPSSSKRSAALYEQMGGKAGLAATYNNIGEIHRARRELDAASEWYARSLKLCEQVGDKMQIALTLHNMGIIALAQKDWARALDLFARSRDLYAGIGLENKMRQEEGGLQLKLRESQKDFVHAAKN